ncbi:unnamed protein product [Auanema sp. JU1783]|nr:unnamed protein product [Auanema sp. JU1783]
MSSRRSRAARDTAKDIILGLAPSGQGPRPPKEGVKRSNSMDVRTRSSTASSSSKAVDLNQRSSSVIVDRRPDNSAIQNLQSQLSELQRHNKELLAAEQAARRRLEANHDVLQRQVMTTGNNGSRDVDDLRRQVMSVDGKVMAMSNDIGSLRTTLDRQLQDLIHINNEMKSRPTVDPNKIASSNQQLDNKIRDLHSNIMQLKQQLEHEKTERNREAKLFGDNIHRLQEIIRQQDRSKTDILNNLSKKGDSDKEKLTEEAKRLNEKINLITNEVTKNMTESTSRIRDEFSNKFLSLESALRSQNENLNELDRESRKKIDLMLGSQTDQIETLNKMIQVDRAKQKDRFQKVNEALAALEHHLELGNKKMDKIMNAEIQSRKLHEKGLLSKMQEIEEKINNYMGGMSRSIEDVISGKGTGKMPALDIDALRREMEAIAADKNKLSMEGLLKLEEKMTRVQTGLYHDKRDLAQKMVNMEENEHTNKLKAQMIKLDSVQDELERTQERIRDKVEKQIPQDLNELSAKADNLKHQLNARIDKEEEERYLAIKELQEAFQRLQMKQHQMPDDAILRRDVDECKMAIRKLAESVTTVKNVLDQKITEESRQRKQDFDKLSNGK